MTTGALERVVRRAGARRAEAAERCGLCGVAVAAGHRHLLDRHDGQAVCVCPACTLLFARDVDSAGGSPDRRTHEPSAGGDHYLLIPTRRVRLPQMPTDVLDVPVGLAFLVRQADGAGQVDGTVVAHYPSPIGTTRASVAPAAWRTLVDRQPLLAGMRPLVEALLVRANARPGAEECWLLPVDDCFRLVAVIRRHWTGMSGGSAVWREIARFFAELARSPGGAGQAGGTSGVHGAGGTSGVHGAGAVGDGHAPGEAGDGDGAGEAGGVSQEE